MRLLLIEDDLKIAAFIMRGLKEAGFAVDHTDNGEYGLHLVLTEPYDTAVIDLMLPKLDGLSIIKRMREQQIIIPVIISSAKQSLDDRIKGFQTGSDDIIIPGWDQQFMFQADWSYYMSVLSMIFLIR